MLHLLKLEWLKFRSNTVFRLMTFAYLLLMPSVLFIGKYFTDLPPPLSNKVFFEFPTVYDYNGYVGNWLVFFFLGFAAIYSITSEWGFKTLRQNIISGLTRKQFYFSKFNFILVLSTLATLYYFICTFCIGYFHAEKLNWSEAFGTEYIILRYFLMCLGYMSFGMLLSFIFRKNGLALFIYFSFIMFIEPIIRWMGHAQIFGRVKSMDFYPMNTMEDLTPMPMYKMAEQFQMGDQDVVNILTSSESTITASIYILLFFGISYYKFMKSDL